VPEASPDPVNPAFLPADFNMEQAVNGMRDLLLEQNPKLKPEMLEPGYVQNIWASDFDGTLGRSANIPVLLAASEDIVQTDAGIVGLGTRRWASEADGKLLMRKDDLFADPKTQAPLMLHAMTSADTAQDLKFLQTVDPAVPGSGKYKDLPWTTSLNADGSPSPAPRNLFAQVWSGFDDPVMTMKTPIEPKMVRTLKQASQADEVTASFIISHRMSTKIVPGMHAALLATNTKKDVAAGRTADVWGVIATGDPQVQAKLGITDPKLSDGQQKAIVQAILQTMLSARTMSWRDDSRGNTGRAIEALAGMFPKTTIRIYDVDHVVGKNHSVPRLIALSNRRGQFQDMRKGMKGTLWTADKLAAHDNEKIPLQPQLTLRDVAR
jgi:hypothetical protein